MEGKDYEVHDGDVIFFRFNVQPRPYGASPIAC